MRACSCLAASAAAALVVSAAIAQPRTYLAMGDSYGFGYQVGDFNTEYGPGDQGYVAPFADWLATRPGVGGGGGVRPRVVNISVPAETTGSFDDVTNLGRIYNSNYNLFAGPSQRDMLLAKVAEEAAAGRVISTVSISMGGNDLLSVRSQPGPGGVGFSSLSLSQQQAAVDGILASMQAGYAEILTLVRGLLPQAELIVVGYFNPFPAVPDSPFTPVSGYAISGLNQRLSMLADQFGGRFVDIAPRFVGSEAAWSYIAADPAGSNIHPNALGYAQIAQAMIPAPGAGVVLIATLAFMPRRRRLVA
jgi:lysophospholipase L1-like esterase